ncbi:MAG: hypothetical protein ACPG7F_10110, partial [Aggregatilineales bacterium]
KEVATLKRSRGKWFWRFITGSSLLAFLLPLLFATADIEIQFRQYSYLRFNFIQALQLSLLVLGTSAAAWYGLLLFRTIAVSGGLVLSERRGKTWETLLLTGMGTWRVVLGKWAGAMGFLRRDYLYLFAVRVGFAIWMNAYLYLNDTIRYLSWQESQEMFYGATLFDTGFHVPSLMLFIILIATFTLLEAMFTTAIGVCVSFLPWKQWGGMVMGLFLRAAIVIIPALVIGGVYAYFNYRLSYFEYLPSNQIHETLLPLTLMATMFFSLADNGMISSSMMQQLPYEYHYGETQLMLAALIIGGLILYVLFTVLFLRLAKTIAYRQGVNSDALPVKTKSKRAIQSNPMTDTTTATNPPISNIETPALTVKQSPGSKNIFDLDTPEQYTVEMFHYRRTLSRLLLRATRNGEAIYLQFSDIRYLDVPASWTGAAFDIADETALHEFVTQEDLTLNSVTEAHTRLYTVKHGDKTLRIVAGQATILHELNERMG